MAIEFSYERLPLASIVLDSIVSLGDKIKTDGGKKLVYIKCINELKDTLVIPNQLIYLDFDIKVDNLGDCIEIKAHNIITGLWFCGRYPLDAEEVIRTKKFFFDDGYYTFDGRTKKIKFIELVKI